MSTSNSEPSPQFEQKPISDDGKILEVGGEVLPGYDGVNAPVFPPEKESSLAPLLGRLSSRQQNANARDFEEEHRRRTQRQIFDPYEQN